MSFLSFNLHKEKIKWQRNNSKSLNITNDYFWIIKIICNFISYVKHYTLYDTKCMKLQTFNL